MTENVKELIGQNIKSFAKKSELLLLKLMKSLKNSRFQRPHLSQNPAMVYVDFKTSETLVL